MGSVLPWTIVHDGPGTDASSGLPKGPSACVLWLMSDVITIPMALDRKNCLYPEIGEWVPGIWRGRNGQ